MFFGLRTEATITSEVKFSGVGVHGGKHVNMKISPAAGGTGLLFKRVDVAPSKKGHNQFVKLSPKSVVDPVLCTRLVNKDGVSVAVVEHLLAAFRICGVTNAVIELDAEEVPIMDGSAIEFVEAFRRVGITQQDALVPAVVITNPVSVSSQNGEISIVPSDESGVSVRLSYDRINPVIGSNDSYKFSFDDDLCDIASARTFGWFEDCEKVRAMGLAKGASEENTVVIMQDNSIKNAGGLRNPKELVMHKCLDLIGDFSVIGYDIIGSVRGLNTSHSLNNLLMRKLLKELPLHRVVKSEHAREFKQALSFA
ncbi:MAG: UDP-3-O-[Alphaproteobacteria bacterium]|nr:UDP-3-O-[3-hydroxymyristoyl] N-acetylglucosamine deacetylase [Alphaproteobacteria bacterium]